MTRNELNKFIWQSISDDIVTCYLTTFDGNYTLLLSKEEGLSELSHTKATE